ncbi:MAG: tryptophan synthase subunit alpha [Actinobacteria bacterium]|jgi:tryptophan synthase alpha chain|nr:MAG: tryptophan synthase subunit alpha [Actinomycetota bacterium]
MSRIDDAFSARGGNGCALIGYATAGFPDRKTCLSIASSLLEHCDILEIGIPFSDPVLDGPVIQESSRRALESGFRVSDAFDLAAELRAASQKPILAMTYYNPVHRAGHAAFAAEAARAGLDGTLIPDLPPEEMAGWKEEADRRGIRNVLFAAMTTPQERLRYLDRSTGGFLYCFAVKGTTGMRDRLAGGLGDFMALARSCCASPLAIGLGISTPDQCRDAAALADGVVVGSALVKAAMDAIQDGEDPAARAGRLASLLKRSLAEQGAAQA